MKGRYLSGLVLGALIFASLAPAAANAVSPTVVDHPVHGCGNALTLHTPSDSSRAMTARDLGLPSSADATFQKAASRHVQWLSTISCKQFNAKLPTRPYPASADTSLNWAGYVATPSSLPTSVQGRWTEPNVTFPPGSGGPAISVLWVGIGGYCSTCQLIQDGTIQQLLTRGDGTIEQDHWFWFEVWPDEGIQVVTNLVPKAADDVYQVTSWSNNQAQFTMCDWTQNKCVQGSQGSSKPPTKSAEWIAERPTLGGGGYDPLSNFNTVSLYQTTYSIGQYQYTASGTNAVTMVNSNNQTMVSPSGVSPDGTNFAVTWYRGS